MTVSPANEQSTYPITVSFTDGTGAAVTPNSASWTLTDTRGTVINNRSNVSITPLSTSATILLSGADLSLREGVYFGRERVLTIASFYDSGAGDDLPLNFEKRFYITDLVAIRYVSLATPTLLLPADDEVIYADPPPFSWNAVTGADTYRFELSTSAAFATLVASQTNTETSYTHPSALTQGTTYYWRVRAQSMGIVSEWSETRNIFPYDDTVFNVLVNTLVQAGECPGWWKFNESIGVTVENYGYLQNAGDADWTPEAGSQGVGGGYLMDGALSKVTVPTNGALKGHEFTIGVLARPTSGGESNAGALFNYADTFDTCGRFDLLTTALNFTVGSTTASFQTRTNQGGIQPIMNEWQFLFFTLSSDAKARIYRGYQGVITEFSYLAQPAWTGTLSASTNLILGNNSGQSRSFAGGIGGAFYVNRPLTTGEMLALTLSRGV